MTVRGSACSLYYLEFDRRLILGISMLYFSKLVLLTALTVLQWKIHPKSIFSIDCNDKRDVCKTVDWIPRTTNYMGRFYMYITFLEPRKVTFIFMITSEVYTTSATLHMWASALNTSPHVQWNTSKPRSQKVFLVYAPCEQFSVKWLITMVEFSSHNTSVVESLLVTSFYQKKCNCLVTSKLSYSIYMLCIHRTC